MMKILKYTMFVVLSMLSICAFGQSDDVKTRISLGASVYSQYLQNGLMLNPAYAGTRGSLSTMLSYRSQWMGMEGAPKMESFSIHTPLENDKVGLGFKSYFMQYGATKETSLHAIYSYHIHLNNGRLSFGLSGGVDVANTDYSSLANLDPVHPDPVFMDDNKAYILPNVSAGVYYYNDKFFAGVSVPRFLNYSNMGNGETDLSVSLDNCSILMTGGAIFGLTEELKLRPSIIIEYNGIDKINQFVLSSNLIVSDLVWIGASWRTTEQVLVGLVQANINPQLSVILSYDVPVGRMNTYSKGSTEIAIRYEFGSKASTADPRYF